MALQGYGGSHLQPSPLVHNGSYGRQTQQFAPLASVPLAATCAHEDRGADSVTLARIW